MKENKKYKRNQTIDQEQSSVVRSCMADPMPIANITSPSLSTSTSPQSQISSGFVSMKDECIQDTSNVIHQHRPKLKKKANIQSLSPPNNRSTDHNIIAVTGEISETHQDILVNSKAEIIKDQLLQKIPIATQHKRLKDISTRKGDAVNILGYENRKQKETSPLSRVQQERQDLMEKMKHFNSEIQNDNNAIRFVIMIFR